MEGGGSVGARLGIWAVLAGATGAGVAIARKRNKARADAIAAAADQGAPVPGGDALAASVKAREDAHVRLYTVPSELDRHGATVLGSTHGGVASKTVRPSDEEPGRAGLA